MLIDGREAEMPATSSPVGYAITPRAADQARRSGTAHLRMSEVRAGIVVTGTEVLTGRIADRNGPWLSEQLASWGSRSPTSSSSPTGPTTSRRRCASWPARGWT